MDAYDPQNTSDSANGDLDTSSADANDPREDSSNSDNSPSPDDFVIV